MTETRDIFSEADIEAAEVHQAIASAPVLEVPEGATEVTAGAAPNCFSAEMTNEAYHSCNSFISHSGMLRLLRSPAHYLTYLTKEEDDKPNVFSACHAAILEPERFDREYLCYPGRRQGKEWEAFRDKNADKTILNTTEMMQAHGARDAVKAFDELPLWALLRASKCETSIFWADPELGVNMRIRPDALNPSVILDVKGIDDARPHKVMRQIVQQEYDLQAAMYVRGVEKFVGKRLPFVFIFVEDKAPHGVWMYTAGQSLLANGERKLRRGAAAFKRLQESGDWHGYRNASTVLELPRWATLEPELDDDSL